MSFWGDTCPWRVTTSNGKGISLAVSQEYSVYKNRLFWVENDYLLYMLTKQ